AGQERAVHRDPGAGGAGDAAVEVPEHGAAVAVLAGQPGHVVAAVEVDAVRARRERQATGVVVRRGGEVGEVEVAEGRGPAPGVGRVAGEAAVRHVHGAVVE